MERLIQYKLNKYASYLSKVQWHIDTNNPTGAELERCEKLVQVYKEVVNDLRGLINRHEELTPDTFKTDPEEAASTHELPEIGE